MVDYDVIVAGAGTGGATTAYTLAKKGKTVLCCQIINFQRSDGILKPKKKILMICLNLQ